MNISSDVSSLEGSISSVGGVLRLPVTVKQGDIEVLRKLCLIVRPEWQQSEFVVKYMPGGSVNYIYIGYQADDETKSNALIFRLFGEMDRTLSRTQEIISMRIAHASGVAQPLYAVFNNGVIYGYAPGVVPKWDDMWKPHIARQVMRSLACLNAFKDIEEHCVDMSGQKVSLDRTPCFITRMWKWLANVPQEFVNHPERAERFKKDIKPHEELKKELMKLEAHLKSYNFPVVYSHNDVWIANFIYNNDKDFVYLLDYEYGAFNYDGFDPGTFLGCFNLQVKIDGTGPSNLLTHEMSVKLVRYYLEARKEFESKTDGTEPGITVTEEELNKYYLQVRVIDIACRFYWGLCLLTLVDNPDVKRIDAIQFAVERFKQYEEDRDELYQIKIPK